MSITIDDVEKMIKNIRRVKHGDLVLANDVLSIKNVCEAMITLLRQQGWTSPEPELDGAERMMNRIPHLESGDVAESDHRRILNDTITSIYQAITIRTKLRIESAFFGDFAFSDLSPNSKYVALALWDEATLCLLNVPKLRIVKSIGPMEEEIEPNVYLRYQPNFVLFSPDSRYVLVSGAMRIPYQPILGSYIEVRRVPDLELISRVTYREEGWEISYIEPHFSPDGSRIVASIPKWSTSEPITYRWTIEIRTSPHLGLVNRREFEVDGIYPNNARFTPDGQYIAAGGMGSTLVFLINPSTLEIVAERDIEYPAGYDINFAMNGKYLIISLPDIWEDGTWKGGFAVLSMPDLKIVKLKIKPEWDSPYYFRITPSGKFIITGIYWLGALEVLRVPSLVSFGRIEGSALYGADKTSATQEYLSTLSWDGLFLLKDELGRVI